MTRGKVLAADTCEGLAPGYYYFEDIMDTNILRFNNYRKVEFDHDFQSMKESINDHGVRVPIQLSYDTFSKSLSVLSGERRSRAVEQLRLESPDETILLPALVFVCDERAEITDLDNTVTSVVSNLMAKGLTQVEKMRCYKILADKGMTKKEIARCCGKDRKTVERSLQLAQFDPSALEFIEAHEKSGMLKARNVEIIGQKLKTAIKEAKKELVSSKHDSDEVLSPKELTQAIKEVELPPLREKEIRDSAFQVLQEEVRRREEAKQPKSDEEKIASREKRENSRMIDIREIKAALEEDFNHDQIIRILEVINQLSKGHRLPSATEQVQRDFHEVSTPVASSTLQ